MINNEDVKVKDSASLPFIYGTAWKEDTAANLTEEALSSGFFAIDTANQRKHYNEEAVGRGIQNYLKRSGKTRSDLFLQTKYTYPRGQDHRTPYDPDTSFSDQVRQSFDSSLKHLQTDYIDSYLLHGPISASGITGDDIEVWSAMESLYDQKKALVLGVANVSLPQLKMIFERSRIKPAYVQNRCFAETGWDLDVRSYCESKRIMYQGFSLLTANMKAIFSEDVDNIAVRRSKTIPQIIFRFCHQSKIICLTGTSDLTHMKQDLDIFSFSLTGSEMDTILNCGMR